MPFPALQLFTVLLLLLTNMAGQGVHACISDSNCRAVSGQRQIRCFEGNMFGLIPASYSIGYLPLAGAAQQAYTLSPASAAALAHEPLAIYLPVTHHDRTCTNVCYERE
jgi:hypothetical protein